MAEEPILKIEATGGAEYVTLNRPERLNALNQPLTDALFAYFEAKRRDADVRVIVLTGAGRAFCSGADLKAAGQPDRLRDGPNGDWVLRDMLKAMRACPQPIIAAVDGVCAGAGAILAMASDLRIATPEAKTAFLFNRVGLAGCDMGACAILPRIIGQGRAAELLYFGRNMTAEEGERWGFFNRLVARDALMGEAEAMAKRIASGPTFANGMTKSQLNQEWNMSIDQAIEAEAQAQAICMRTKDFERAYRAFVDKRQPVFEGD